MDPSLNFFFKNRIKMRARQIRQSVLKAKTRQIPHDTINSTLWRQLHAFCPQSYSNQKPDKYTVNAHREKGKGKLKKKNPFHSLTKKMDV